MKKDQKIKIYLKAYDHKLLDSSAKKIIEAIVNIGAKVSGPIPMPTHIKRYTVLRSVHVNKDSREQFEMRVHRRAIEIHGTDPKVISTLSSFSIPSGVGIEIKQCV